MRPLTIRRATGSAADYDALAQIAASAPPDTLTDFETSVAAELRSFDAAFATNGHGCWRYVAELDGAAVGGALLFHIPWLPAPGRYWLTVRVVPAARQQGVCRALERQLGADLAALQPRAVWVIVQEATPEIVAAAERRGFRERLRTNPLTLDLAGGPVLDPAPFVARVLDHGLTITTLAAVQQHDPAWLAKLHALHMQLTREVPLPEELFTTPDEFRGFILEDAAALPEAYFLACDGATYVGQSFMQPLDDQPGALRQELTGTLPAYRGKGIAQALKALTVDYARTHGYQSIHTWVESNNPGMLAVNARFGFIAGPGNVLLERLTGQDDEMTG